MPCIMIFRPSSIAFGRRSSGNDWIFPSTVTIAPTRAAASIMFFGPSVGGYFAAISPITDLTSVSRGSSLATNRPPHQAPAAPRASRRQRIPPTTSAGFADVFSEASARRFEWTDGIGGGSGAARGRNNDCLPRLVANQRRFCGPPAVCRAIDPLTCRRSGSRPAPGRTSSDGAWGKKERGGRAVSRPTPPCHFATIRESATPGSGQLSSPCGSGGDRSP